MKPPFENEPPDMEKKWDAGSDLFEEADGDSTGAIDDDDEIIELVDVVEDDDGESPGPDDPEEAELLESEAAGRDEIEVDSGVESSDSNNDLDAWFESDAGEQPATDPMVASMGLDLEDEEKPAPETELAAIAGEPIEKGSRNGDLVEPPVAPEAVELTPEQIESALERVIEKVYGQKIQAIMMGLIEEKVTGEIEKIKSLILDETDGDTPHES